MVAGLALHRLGAVLAQVSVLSAVVAHGGAVGGAITGLKKKVSANKMKTQQYPQLDQQDQAQLLNQVLSPRNGSNVPGVQKDRLYQ